MRKIVLASLLCFLFVASIAPAYASVTFKTIINDSFYVSFDFININSTLYYGIRAQGIFNSTSIPQAIVRNLEKQNLMKVSYQLISTDPFNATEKSIHVEFSLGGEDILSYTVDRATLVKTYNAKTNWIRFDIKLSDTFTLNFSTYFATSVSNWQRINYTINGDIHSAFYYNSTIGTAPFNVLCYFILPTKAMNIKAIVDTLIFEMPPLLEDRLIDSPILILGAIIVANIVVIIYRKIRK